MRYDATTERKTQTKKTKQSSIKEVPTVHGLAISADGQLQEITATTDTILVSPQLVREMGVSASNMLAVIYNHTLSDAAETDPDGVRWVQVPIRVLIKESGLPEATALAAHRWLKEEKFIVTIKDGPLHNVGQWYAVNLAPRTKKQKK